MPLSLPAGNPTLLIRSSSYERVGLSRARIDEMLTLTDQEFRAEPGLVAIGPVYDTDALSTFVDELEAAGLVYYEDFFELSGVWPDWLRLYAGAD